MNIVKYYYVTFCVRSFCTKMAGLYCKLTNSSFVKKSTFLRNVHELDPELFFPQCRFRISIRIQIKFILSNSINITSINIIQQYMNSKIARRPLAWSNYFKKLKAHKLWSAHRPISLNKLIYFKLLLKLFKTF